MASGLKDDAKNSEHEASPGKIFIGGLPKDMNTVMKHYGKYGETVDSVIVNDGHAQHPRGLGFTTYADPSVVDKVIEENHLINCKQILKSGPLFISSKGIGWTSWKKRWFVLSRKSLMFYRTDPTALPQKGSEAPNPTLGGIELNNSGSVVVKQDKKLLSVIFSDGRDGRAFTLKTETLDELNEWKIALEDALTLAPSASHVMGQNGIFCNEVADVIEASVEQCMDKLPTTSLVVGRPALLALEDIDGSPSFLEKALSFIEEHGIKVEGILRQSADVEEVVRRVQEYEQGKKEFSSDEDAHVIGDCIKHVLREMPSSPVPASCCTALVDAYRTDRVSRVDYIRDAIHETFPEPNRRLLQRTLQMMLTVAAHKAENRMSLSALAACMAPLLLRPLVAGECELKNDFQIDGDGSFQLLQAAAAANHAQAIMIILLEEYANIFDYEDSEDEEDIEDDESTDNDILQEVGYHDVMNELKSHSVGDLDRSYSGTSCGNDSDVFSDDSNDLSTDVGSDVDSCATVNNVDNIGVSFMKSVAGSDIWSNLPIDQEIKENENSSRSILLSQKSLESSVGALYSTVTNKLVNIAPSSSTITYLSEPSKEALPALRNKWGRTPARKNLSVELIEYISDDESVVNRLENDKIDLQTKISKEIEGNAVLQANLDRRKEVLHEHRLALEKEVVKLQLQLQKEKDLRLHLEFGLVDIQPDHFFNPACLDNKTRMDLEEIALSVTDINNLKQNISDLTKQLQQDHATFCESCGQLIYRNMLENVSNIPNVQKHDNLFKHDNNIADSENLKDNVKSSTVLVNIQSFQKLPPKNLNQSSTTSSGASSSSEDRHSASKKVERWDNSKKDAPVYSEDQISPLCNTSTRKHAPKYEEGASSSSAMTKLTNRLNFLKERRVQLANELQNMDPSRAAGLDSHSKTNSAGHGS